MVWVSKDQYINNLINSIVSPSITLLRRLTPPNEYYSVEPRLPNILPFEKSAQKSKSFSALTALRNSIRPVARSKVAHDYDTIRLADYMKYYRYGTLLKKYPYAKPSAGGVRILPRRAVKAEKLFDFERLSQRQKVREPGLSEEVFAGPRLCS